MKEQWLIRWIIVILCQKHAMEVIQVIHIISYFIIWNEVGPGGWFDYSPILSSRYDSSNQIDATQIEQ